MNKIPIDEIFHSSSEEIIPIRKMEDRNPKMVIFDENVCENNQNDIINYFIQGRHKNCCVIYLSQSYYKTLKEHRIDKEAFKSSFKNKYDFLYIDKQRKIAKKNFIGNHNIWDYSIIL